MINATGIVVHTNLGRAPWSEAAATAAAAVTDSYCSLEMDLDSGLRGGRLDGLNRLLTHLTGAPAGLIVNNNAAAVLLALTALTKGGEVVVSRGELVEIGGSFRVPEIITAGGAHLVEVGATNRTRLADFAGAITDQTKAVLRVHRSNFKVVGFTHEPDRAELVNLAHDKGVYALEDLGSGCMEPFADEPSVASVVTAGTDVVMFSGDKLLGGPQAGFAVGTVEAISKMAAHPMYRALRVDKTTLAAAEATLALWARGDRPPVVRMIEMSVDELEARALRLKLQMEAAGVPCVCEPDQGFAGGGALPGKALDTWVVRVSCKSVNRVARALRLGDPSVVARVAGDMLVLDSRTVLDRQLDALVQRVAFTVSNG